MEQHDGRSISLIICHWIKWKSCRARLSIFFFSSCVSSSFLLRINIWVNVIFSINVTRASIVHATVVRNHFRYVNVSYYTCCCQHDFLTLQCGFSFIISFSSSSIDWNSIDVISLHDLIICRSLFSPSSFSFCFTFFLTLQGFYERGENIFYLFVLFWIWKVMREHRSMIFQSP